MTDEQIIEALKITSEDIVCAVVDENNNTHFVTNQNVLSLIERQREEKEELIDECGSQSVLWRNYFASIYETAKETIKAEARVKAIREFAERLYAKEDKAACSVSVYDISDIVKELTEKQI